MAILSIIVSMTILQNEYAKAQTISIYIWKIKKKKKKDLKQMHLQARWDKKEGQ
jgi:hypothetical protein